MNKLSQILDELVSCGEGLIRATNALREMCTAEEPVGETKTYSFIDVRKAFSAKSHEGFTDQIKAVISKYGADKLSSVKEEDYPALMADLEAIR